jgi:hypothetical protein
MVGRVTVPINSLQNVQLTNAWIVPGYEVRSEMDAVVFALLTSPA